MKKIIGNSILLFLLVPFSIAGAQQYSVSTGILTFVDSDKVKNRGESTASALSSELFKYKFIKLVERSMMKESIKEMELGMTGLIDEKTAVKVGKIHGLQLMIIGTIDNDSVNARAIHVETQKVIAAYTVKDISQIDELAKKLAGSIEVFLVRESIGKMKNDNPDIGLTFRVEKKDEAMASKILPGGKAKIGESIVFHFKADRDGYVTIIDIQPGGDIVVLFPNDSSPANEVKANVEYAIPSEKDAFEVTVTEPAGTDTVVAFFTLKKVDWLDRKQLMGEGFWSVKENKKMEMTRGLSIKSTGLKRSEWKTQKLEIEVVE